MLVSQKIEFLAFALFASLVLLAAEQDMREHRIANRLSLILAVLAPVHLVSGTWAETFSALAFSAVVLGAGALMFARGWVGGGDVKLMAAIALWTGFEGGLLLLAATTLAGGALALAFFLARIRRMGIRRALGARVPYGPAIALGGLFAIAPGLAGLFPAFAG